MLLTIERLVKAPVMSLQTGYPLCWLDKPIIDPRTLQIVAFYVSGPLLDFSPAVLFTEDIREFGSMGAIVDSVDNIMSPEGMVRLNEVIDMNFDPVGIKVVDENKKSLGKVSYYVVDDLNFDIQQIVVQASIWSRFTSTGLTINRSQITKIEPNKITVASPTIKEKFKENPVAARPEILNPDFDNPFRKPGAVANNNDYN